MCRCLLSLVRFLEKSLVERHLRFINLSVSIDLEHCDFALSSHAAPLLPMVETVSGDGLTVSLE